MKKTAQARAESEAEQTSSDLPRGWCLATLGQVADLKGGLTKGKRREPGAGLRSVPYLRVANVQRGRLDLDEVLTIEATDGEIADLQLRPGDVLFNEGGDRDKLGRGWIWQGELPMCIHQNHVFRARLRSSGIPPKFVSCYGNSAGQRYFWDEGKHTTNLASINLTKLGNFPIPIPPAAEAGAVVEALDSYLSRLDAATEGLKRVAANLKRYRASVLKAAVEGRLVPTEAELARQERRDYEPASVLLDRILKERRRRWEEAELAKMKAKGELPKNDKWKDKYQAPASPDTSSLPELPEGWCWASVDQLASDAPYSLTDGPFGSNLKSAHYVPDGPRVIRLQNIGDGVFLDERAHISDSHFEDLKRHRVFAGDILIASLGTELPRACIVPPSLGPAIVKADCIRFANNAAICEARFVMWALNAEPTRKRTEAAVHGVGRPRIGLTLLREVAIPLPPLHEQERVSSRIDALVSDGEAIRGACRQDTHRVERLRQSILRWAFEGKLVDQDPKDEPASVLLERIRAERAATEPVKTPRPERTRRKSA